MMRPLHRWLLLLILPLLCPLAGVNGDDKGSGKSSGGPDLADFRTAETAKTTQISRTATVSSAQPSFLGIDVTLNGDKRLSITEIAGDSPASKAGLVRGDVITQVDGNKVTGAEALDDVLHSKAPGELVKLAITRKGKPLMVTATLAAVSRPLHIEKPDSKSGGFDTRLGNYWKKEVYHLAVVCVEFPDLKHNAKIGAKVWDEALFSRATYTKTSATGQSVYGSLFDYYLEQSYGALRVEGKVFDYVEASKKRSEYGDGNNKAPLLIEAVDKLLERAGKEALKDFDGLVFVYAGETGRVARGSLYWPHKGNFRLQGKNWPYFICPEGGGRMSTISVFCHEFGHMLGLPDLYARPEIPGSDGLGVWCAMSNQVGNGRPQHFCAWSKEKLGWIKPAVLDPNDKQKLILAPVETSGKECFKILVRPDGSEYFLIENRSKTGFDKSLPGEGLLVWRIVNDRPILVESHGLAGHDGPRVYLDQIPFPSSANNAFTPFTTPSSRSELGEGWSVNITNIRRLPDGRMTFSIGYEYQ